MNKIFNATKTRFTVQERVGETLAEYESGFDEVTFQQLDRATGKEIFFSMPRAEFEKVAVMVKRAVK